MLIIMKGSNNVIYQVSVHLRVKNHFKQSLLPSISQQRIKDFTSPKSPDASTM